MTVLSAELDELAEQLANGDMQQQAQQLRDSIDKLNIVAGRVADLEGRVQENEEWVQSINAFRRQVNQRLNTQQGSGAVQPNLQ